MQHLDHMNEVGRGLRWRLCYVYGWRATAVLPAAGKLKLRIREEQLVKEMALEGLSRFWRRMNPR